MQRFYIVLYTKNWTVLVITSNEMMLLTLSNPYTLETRQFSHG